MDEYAKKLEKREAKKRYDSFPDMMAFEDGSIDEKGAKRLFQHLVNTGQAWHLQGMYGRVANDMLESGFIKPPPKGHGHKDAYGNDVEHLYAKHRK